MEEETPPPPVNSAATGIPFIIGSMQVGGVVYVWNQFKDANNVTEANPEGRIAYTNSEGVELDSTVITYEWSREDPDGSNKVVISGATTYKYTLTSADLGKKLRVKLTFTDMDMFDEELEATNAFPYDRTRGKLPSSYAVVHPATITGSPACDEPTLTGRKVIYESTVNVAFSQSYSQNFQGYRRYGEQFEAITYITGSMGSPTFFMLNGNRYDIVGLAVHTSNIVDGTLRFWMSKQGAADGEHVFSEDEEADLQIHVCDDTFAFSDTSRTPDSVRGFIPNNDFKFDNIGLRWTDTPTRTIRLSVSAPTVETAEVDDTTVTLTFTEDLDDTSVPPASAFSANINLIQVEPTNVAISGKVVTLTLPQSVAGNDRVSLSYTAPASNAIQNMGGVEADSFTDQTVTATTSNNRPEAANGSVTVAEDGTHTFTAADFNFNDPDSDPLASVTLVRVPSTGSLTFDGNPAAVDDILTAQNLTANQLVYTPVANEHGDDYASLAFEVSDGTYASLNNYTITINVSSVPDPATGAPVIMGELARVGQTVTVDTSSIADGDGLPDTFQYQWHRIDGEDPPNETPIMDADTSEYTLTADDIGARLKVEVRFTDLEMGSEGLTSALWPEEGVIAPLPRRRAPVEPEEEEAVPLTVNIDRGVSEGTEPFTITITFSAPVFGFSLQDIVAEHAELSDFMGEDGGTMYTAVVTPTGEGLVMISVAAGVVQDEHGNDNEGSEEESMYTPPPPPPPAPELELPEDGSTALMVTWQALPAEYCSGCPPIARYELQYQQGSGPDWVDVSVTVSGTGDTRFATIPLPDLAHDYRVRIRAVNADGMAGEWSVIGEWEMPDEFLPMKDRSMKAWHAHFGRAVGTQVLNAVSDRLSGDKGPFLKVAGMTLDENTDIDAEETVQQWITDIEEGRGLPGLPALPRLDTALKNSAFSLRHRSWGAYGHVAHDTFEGSTLNVDIDGDVTTGMLGMDWTRGAWTHGVLFSRSEGDGDYRGDSIGRIESEVVGAWPYGRYQVTERFSLWGVAGYGQGELKYTPEDEDTIRTDMDVLMGALGARGIALEAPEDGGLQLAITSDAMTVRSSSEAVAGLVSSSADTVRFRLGLEGTWQGLEGWTPGIEVGIRHDDGDAEHGYGVDIGTSLVFADPEGTLSGEVRARGLLTHEDGGFEQFGISGSLNWDPKPSSQRGPSLTLQQSMGAPASGGMTALLEQKTMTGLPQQEGDVHLQLKAGYGFAVVKNRYTLVPEVSIGQGPGQQDYQLGLRMDMISRKLGGFEVDLRTQRLEHDQGAPEHSIGLKVAVRY